MLRKTSSFWVVLTLALSSSLVTASWGRANESATKFNIPPQALDSALLVFAEQADVQVSVATVSIEGIRTQGVVGRFTPSVALARLLTETGLQFTTIGDRTFSVSQGGSGNARNGRALDREGDAARTLAQTEPTQVASVATSPGADSTIRRSQNEGNGGGDVKGLQGEVIVTGSHIHDVESAGTKLIVIDREEIDRSGYATMQDVLKTLPQNFGGGASEFDFSDTSGGNFNQGTAANLRGLGIDSTLVLVNGRRQPVGGVNGAFVDISSIPAAAIERIEVLTDGSSSIYGSDAVAGVVNFITRRNYEGAETRVRFGTYGGDAEETQIAQILGQNWSGGNVLVGYQYYTRGALERADRAYTASDDFRRYGGSDFRSFQSNPGNIVSPTTGQPAFAIPSGQDGRSLAAADLLPGVVNLRESSADNELLPEQEIHNAFVSLTQALGEHFELFTEGRYSVRDMTRSAGGRALTVVVPSSNPFFVDPFGGSPSVRVAYNFLDDLGPALRVGEAETYTGALGVSAGWSEAWRINVNVSRGREENDWRVNDINTAALTAALADTDPATAFNPFGDGSNTNRATLDAIGDGFQRERGVSDFWTASAIVDGSLFGALRDRAKFAIGADHRQEDLVGAQILTSSATSRSFNREVSAVFAELALPFVGVDNARPGIAGLVVSIAGRYEDYSDFGSTFNPKIGISWMPIEMLKVRSTWGTSFKAPRLVDLNEALPMNFAAPLPFPDPQSPTGRSIVFLRGGNNANLQEETATVWTAGIDISPSAVDGFEISLTYYDIEYDDRVAPGGPPGNPFGVLFEEEIWRDIITRNPSQADIEAFCNDRFLRVPVATCLATTPAAIVDVRLRNLATLSVRGVDLDVSQSIDTSIGILGFALNGSYVLDFERAVTANSLEVDVVDTVNNPQALRLRGELSWNLRDFGATAFVNYAGSYRNSATAGNSSIDSWTTVDLGLSYRPSLTNEWLENLRISVNAVNVFDEEPPFVNIAFSGYDTANANLYGRVISAQLIKEW